ncbi:MAG: cytochrome c oxidase accessory protein CcoG [Planctomycetota bacterium JB042]
MPELRNDQDRAPDMLRPEEHVLSTLNADGSRRWLKPRLSRGRFLTRRRVVAWALIVAFTVVPFLRTNGKPVLLFDLANREFTFFGTTFLATETLLLALLIVSIFLGIFLLTALFGRVWCGWACPQTVYMEFVYRPLERLFDRVGRRWPGPAVALRWITYVLVSLYLANTFLAYFVGVDTLKEWVTRSPFEHPGAFLVVAAVTLLMLADFGLMREQVCTLMCPYGRFQSVLLDRSSLIISYDEKRGEPRGPIRRGATDGPPRGDCVACGLCVRTCPTGIDIRDGLQMECIGCAQCIDACDEVMDKVDRPRGLIRYSSREAMEHGKRKLLRARVFVYPALLLVALTAFSVALGGRRLTEVNFLRHRDTPYVVDADGVTNPLRVKLTNKHPVTRSYRIGLGGLGILVGDDRTLEVPPGAAREVELKVTLPADRFERGRATIVLVVTDDEGTVTEVDHDVLGPLFPGVPEGDR